MDLQEIAATLARMHDGRWQYSSEEVRLFQPGSINWRMVGRAVAGSNNELLIIAHWAPNDRDSGAHEARLYVWGTPVEIAQQVMAKLPLMQRSVQLAFDEGLRVGRADYTDYSPRPAPAAESA